MVLTLDPALKLLNSEQLEKYKNACVEDVVNTLEDFGLGISDTVKVLEHARVEIFRRGKEESVRIRAEILA